MKSFLLIMLSCRVLSYPLPIFPKTEKVTEEEEKLPEKHLNSIHPQPDPRNYLRSEDDNIAIGKIRPKKFCGVKVTEKRYSDTPDGMKRPRSDIPNIGAYSHFPGPPKWRTMNLTYSIQNYTPDLPSAAIIEAIKRAFVLWSKVTPLNFIKVAANGNISFFFYNHGHKTPFNESVIAYAYGPGKGLGGDVFLNDEVVWTMDNKKTFAKTDTNLLITCAHEVGHSLGLGHSLVPGSLMNEEYTPLSYRYGKPGDCRTLKLHPDDIAGIQALYGPRPRAKSKSSEPSNHTPTPGTVSKTTVK